LRNRLRDLRQKRSNHQNQNSKRPKVTPKQRAAILGKTGNRCHICGGQIAPNAYWEADHVFPAAAGGDGQIANFLPAHGLCNSAKLDHHAEELQWIVRIGVWAKKQMEEKTDIGNEMLKLFWTYQQSRVNRQKPNQTIPNAN